MKKKVVSLVLIASLSMGLVACGNNEKKDAVKNAGNSEEYDVIGDTVTYDPGGKDIDTEFWYWTGASNLFESLVDQYTKYHPNVNIELVENPYDDYWTKLPLALQGTDGPAIFNMHNSQHDNLIDYMAPYDIPVDDIEAEFTGASGHVIDDKLYYTDYGLMTATLYYNTDMWKKIFRQRGTNLGKWLKNLQSEMAMET